MATTFSYHKCSYIAKQYFLSPRETQCLHLIIQGNLAKQISSKLGLSQRTIEYYTENIKIKLDCRTKIDLVIKVLTSNNREVDSFYIKV